MVCIVYFLPTIFKMSDIQSISIPRTVDLVEEPVTTPPARTFYEIAMTALMSGPIPDLIVFDCDWTLYPYDCDKDRFGPFTYTPWGGVQDAIYRYSSPYAAVPSIFGAMIDAKIPTAFLSRNPSAKHVKQLLSVIPCTTKMSSVKKSLLDTMPYPQYFHAYSSNNVGHGKDMHFAALQRFSGIPFKNMLFFDDMPDNIEAATKQGTASVLLKNRNGLTIEAFVSGLQKWRLLNSPIQSLEG